MEEDNSKTRSIEGNREYHRRYFLAINNPLRRKILKAIKEGHSSINDLKNIVGLKEEILKWHLNILEHGYCVKNDLINNIISYTLTQEGDVIDYLNN